MDLSLLYLIAMLLTMFNYTTITEASLNEEIQMTQETVDRLNSMNLGFKAKLYPQFAGLTLDQLKHRAGVSSKPSKYFNLAKSTKPQNIQADDMQPFDISDKWPECKDVFNDIQMQGNCSAMWAFAVTTSIRDRICIAEGTKDPISAWDLISCCEDCWTDGQDGCNGGDHISALRFIKTNGSVSGGQYRTYDTCKPYPVRPNSNGTRPKKLACLKSCILDYTKHSYEQDKRYVNDYKMYTYSNRNVWEEIRRNGPAVAEFALYQDFTLYSGGIYKQTKGSLLGYGYAKIIGWGVDQNSGESFWRAAASFCPNWGEHGTFRIARGHDEVGFESSIAAPYVKYPTSVFPSTSTSKITSHPTTTSTITSHPTTTEQANTSTTQPRKKTTTPSQKTTTTHFLTNSTSISSTISSTSKSTTTNNCIGLETFICDHTNLTNKNVGDFIRKVNASLNPETANEHDVYWLSLIFQKISEVKHMFKSDSTVFYQLYDKSLNIHEKTFYSANILHPATSLRILQSIDTFLINAIHDLTLFEGSNLAMLKYYAPTDCNILPGVGLADYGESFGVIDLSTTSKASIQIPHKFGCINDLIRPMFFVGHKTHKLFMPIPNTYSSVLAESNQRLTKKYAENQTNPCNIDLHFEKQAIFTAVIINLNDSDQLVCSNKQVMAEIKYTKPFPALHGRQVVSWWDRSNNEWSRKCQCETYLKGNELIAECTHLTDFTLLIDGRLGDPSLCDATLSFIGNILVIFSAMGLLLISSVQYINLYRPARIRCFKLFLLFPRLHHRAKLLDLIRNINFFLFYALFGLFADQKRAFGMHACEVFAQLSYILLMSAIILTVFQSWKFLVAILGSSEIKNNLLFWTQDSVCILLTFAIPLFISFAAHFINSDFFNRGDGFCWVNPEDTFWSLVIPLSIPSINSFICMILIIRPLFKGLVPVNPLPGMRRSVSIINQGTRSRLRNKALMIIFAHLFLGLPWALQYLTLYAESTTIWHYLFTVVNASQGIILFALFAYRRLQIRDRNSDEIDRCLNYIHSLRTSSFDPRESECQSRERTDEGFEEVELNVDDERRSPVY